MWRNLVPFLCSMWKGAESFKEKGGGGAGGGDLKKLFSFLNNLRKGLKFCLAL